MMQHSQQYTVTITQKAAYLKRFTPINSFFKEKNKQKRHGSKKKLLLNSEQKNELWLLCCRRHTELPFG